MRIALAMRDFKHWFAANVLPKIDQFADPPFDISTQPMRCSMTRNLATIVAVLALAGCATSGNKVDPSTIASFKPGVTTMAEVEAALGQPFQATQMPDGTEQLQYVSKVRDVAAGDAPTTGSEIPKYTNKNVSTMLSFDRGGHFVRAWSNTQTQTSKNGPSDLGTLQPGDVHLGSGQGH